ncbi:MAG: LysE family translocator [Rhodospirillaceae bacterium]|nr:LysE family translocator [Rhodospirillaceae bacterium]
MHDLLSFVVAGFALAGSPGPNTLSLAATGAAFGARRGLRYLAGLGVGMIAVMLIAGSGVMGVVLAIPGAAPVIAGLAAAYFLYLAYRIATAPPLAESEGKRRPPAFLAGVFQSLVNPKAYAAMAALFSGFVLVADSLGLDMAIKLAVVTGIITTVNVAWLLAGAGLTRLFREPATNRAINIAFAVALLVSVALAVLV